MPPHSIAPLAAATAVAVVLAGCAYRPTQPNASTYFMEKQAEHERMVNERKDEVIRDLAMCESGGWGPSERPIYGGRGAYLGRLQFAPRTVIAYAKRRDGTQLTYKEAADLAQDYDRAAELAKYMIFDLGETSHWPLCGRKIKLAAQVKEILAL